MTSLRSTARLCALTLLLTAACTDDAPVDPPTAEPEAQPEASPEVQPEANPEAQPEANPEPEPLCTAGQTRCADARTVERCDDPLAGFAASPCPDPQICDQGQCIDPDCTLGQATCLNLRTLQTCEDVEGIPTFTEVTCGGDEVCDAAACQARVCDPDALPTCEDLDTALVCEPPGLSVTPQDCFPGQVCVDQGCQTQLCNPGTTICRGDNVEICNEVGTAYVLVETCSPDEIGTTCFDGQCIDACAAARIDRAYVGCEYTGLDLPNSSVSELRNGFAIAISNPSDTLTASVTISTEAGPQATLQIAPRSVETFIDTDRNFKLRGTGLFPFAFRVTSTVPVVVFQFNSYRTLRAASTDGSLLIPEHALFDQYFAMTYSGDRIGAGSEPFIVITAPNPGTSVTVTPTADTAASINGSLVAIPGLAAGSATTFTLDSPFHALVLIATTGTNDLTGSLIQADAPIGVYSGNFATQVPTGRTFRDHLEQQIFPRQALGKRYVVAKSAPRGINNVNVADQLRVLADLDGTTITFNPPLQQPVTLDSGQWIELPISDHLEVNSTEPVMLGIFFAGSNGAQTSSTGDPTFILQVPTEQFRDNYVFLCPPTYTTDYVSITAPVGAQVALDGQPVELSQTPIGDSNLSVTIIEVTDGEHELIGDLPFGVSVYGYGGPPSLDPDNVQNVSYGYPGGLNLNEINPKE